MRIAKKYKTILCDDVRTEIGGKMSLMGIYGREFVVDRVPTVLPIISFVIMLEEVTNSPSPSSSAMPRRSCGPPILIRGPKPDDLKPGMDANITMGLSPFKIEATGEAKFEVRFAEKETPRIIHRFKIKLAGE